MTTAHINWDANVSEWVCDNVIFTNLILNFCSQITQKEHQKKIFKQKTKKKKLQKKQMQNLYAFCTNWFLQK